VSVIVIVIGCVSHFREMGLTMHTPVPGVVLNQCIVDQ